MCFYNDDCEWSASLVEDQSGTSGPSGAAPKSKCDECRRPIPVGAWRRTIFMQEHEECQICQDDCSDSFIDRAEVTSWLADPEMADDGRGELARLDDHTCDYGESGSCTRCEACDKVLRSIEAHEVAAGCPPDARQPALWSLWDEMDEHDDGPTYLREAVALFPELAEFEPVANRLTT